MTPIQTKFAGNLYRSRLEARYAVLFQACRLPFEYQREGFLLEQGRYLPYLPDFWLPTLGTWLEVKGMLPGARDNAISQLLADQTQRRVIIACGPPEMAANLSCFFPDWHGTLFQTLSAFLMQWLPPEIVIRAIGTAQSARFEFGETPKIVPLRLEQRRSTEALPF